jgi:hypothetical protein
MAIQATKSRYYEKGFGAYVSLHERRILVPIAVVLLTLRFARESVVQSRCSNYSSWPCAFGG